MTNIHRQPEGWSVVVRRGGRNYSDYFGSGVWGGRARALVAAQRFRDQLLRRIGPDTRERRQMPKGRRSKTGVVGVSIERYPVDGRFYERYVAHWQDPEKGARRRRFSIKRYGKEEALAMATDAREAGVAHNRARLLAQQREDAKWRLQKAPPMPRQVKDPLSRKGISMARRRPRRVK